MPVVLSVAEPEGVAVGECVPLELTEDVDVTDAEPVELGDEDTVGVDELEAVQLVLGDPVDETEGVVV